LTSADRCTALHLIGQSLCLIKDTRPVIGFNVLAKFDKLTTDSARLVVKCQKFCMLFHINCLDMTGRVLWIRVISYIWLLLIIIIISIGIIIM